MTSVQADLAAIVCHSRRIMLVNKGYDGYLSWPENMSDRMPERMSEQYHACKPDRMSEYMSDKMPECMSDRMSQYG